MVGHYWHERRRAVRLVARHHQSIDKNDFYIRWLDEPLTPALKSRRQHIAILHPEFRVTREWETSLKSIAVIIAITQWGGLRVAPLHFAHARKPARPSQPPTSGDQAMTSTTASTAERIRALNDDFRRTFVGGMVVITAGVEAMPADQRKSLLAKVRAFDAFTDDNDPHREHDFGAVDEGGVRYFWKVDCYDRATEFGSPDPADPAVTTRVLTIMRADEY